MKTSKPKFINLSSDSHPEPVRLLKVEVDISIFDEWCDLLQIYFADGPQGPGAVRGILMCTETGMCCDF